MQWIADATCSPYSEVCRAASGFFSHAYAVVFCFLAIIAFTKAKQLQDFAMRLKKAVEVIMVDSRPNKPKSD